MEQRMDELTELTHAIGQLVVVQDARIRELGTVFRCVLMPRGSPIADRMEKMDEEWKRASTSYNLRKANGGGAEKLGSKHLRVAAVLLNGIHADPQTKQEVKEELQTRWEGKDTNTPEFLEADVKVAKWRVSRDGKHGILEFKLTETLMAVEEEIIRVLLHHGGTLKSGPGPKGERVRDVEKRLEGTWTRTRGERD